jgi:hypothetical protein
VTRYVPEEVERYAEAHSTPPPALFDRLAAQTRSTQEFPEMMVGPLEGTLHRRLHRLVVDRDGARPAYGSDARRV